MSEYDVIVVGGGAAGLSGALVLSRAQRRVLVVDGGQPRNAPAAALHGFLSRDGMAPAELLAIGRQEVRSSGGEVTTGTVSEIQRHGEHFRIEVNGRFHSARRILLATGLSDRLPDVPGLSERWARDVLHCPYCHGHEVRGQRLGVLGGAAGSVRYAQLIRQWSHDVVLFVPPGRLDHQERRELTARAIGIVEGEVTGLRTVDDRLRAIQVAGAPEVPRDALFVPPTFEPHTELLVALGAELDDGWVRTDATGQSSVRGVWVAGNLSNPRAQLITAAGEGSAAAIAINADLVDDDVRRAVSDLTSSHEKESTR